LPFISAIVSMPEPSRTTTCVKFGYRAVSASTGWRVPWKALVPLTASAAVSSSEKAMSCLPAVSSWMFCTEAPVSLAVTLWSVLAEMTRA
jgi:hypothetical protein